MVVAVRIAPPSLDQPFGLHARCGLPPAADRSRRLSAPRVGLPALGTASPRPLCPSDISPAQRGKPWDEGGGTDAGWLVRRRRAPAARSGILGLPRFGTALATLHRNAVPMRDAAGVTKTLRLGAMVDHAFDAVLPSFPHVAPCGRSGQRSAHVCAALCRCRSVFKYTTDVAGVKSLSESGVEGLGATTRDRPYVVVGTNNVIPAKAGIQRGGRQRCGVAPPLSFGHSPAQRGKPGPAPPPGIPLRSCVGLLGSASPFAGRKGTVGWGELC